MTAIDVVRQRALSEEIQDLYARTKAKVGEEDLAHIRAVSAYSKAIDARRRELLRSGGPKAVSRAVVLEMLYRLLQFSELGHNIIHGSYDHLPNAGEFHSDRYDWDFNVDIAEWKVMHHEGHHPNTNILGRDHDLGYSVVRAQAGQDWFGHHALQLLLVGGATPFFTQVAPFVVSNAARQMTNSPFFSVDTLRVPAKVAYRDTVRRLITEPRAAGSRFLPTLLGNHVGGVVGYLAVLFLVIIEHHAGDVEVFPEPGPDETRDQYYTRQIRATRNFLRNDKLDSMLQRILEEEVPFENRPDFRIFYGGLDTHVEHHLFPDLPPNRQREIAPQVKDIALRHGLPYHETPIGDTAALLVQALTGLSVPVGERENSSPLRLLKQPLSLARRVVAGAKYRMLPDGPYLAKPRWYNVPTRVVATQELADGRARLVRLERPHGWDDVRWDAGAFISVRVEHRGESLVRQYSLVNDSDGSDTMDICIKRVDGGRVSNLLNDTLNSGAYVTLVGAPASTGGLIMTEIPAKSLFVAGGVGITPIISQLRRIARERNASEPGAEPAERPSDTGAEPAERPSDAVLLYFNRDKQSTLFEREIRELGRKVGIRVHLFTGELASATLIEQLVPDAHERETFVCAPSGLVDAVRGYLTDMGQPAPLFHTESFTPPELVRPVDDGRRYTVTFRRSDRKVEIDGATTLLEAATRAGISVPTGCRRGLCRACVTPKLSGTTQNEDSGTEVQRITVCDSLACSDIDLDL
ncbi:fatty acid desaturase [Hoyosella subflava]|uniref:Fatty acid desaturase n=1 Tax=Hoyosella subflava (strain DSM 45089 / JCM 17490 / NBRC 109087 / DQS3-9A1) TaxID=443218 RepID=F6ENP6_HOYSD|nr:fatty acid desaturase [Hoyosella subflava]AEF42903.1 Fatty acid desaturase [Hoyosella subflava DQS3-9A1]